MSLIDFLFHHTKAKELCVICVNGFIVATVYIDYEDRFVKYLSKDFDSMVIVKHERKPLMIYSGEGISCSTNIPAHYIYLEDRNNG
jgi:hypothetical protein